MNKKIIKQLLDDKETRARIAVMFGQMAHDAAPFWIEDDTMLAALNKLNDEPVKGEMITIEISDHMWVRGEYVRTEPDGQVAVAYRNGTWDKFYAGKRVDLVIKAKEGEADV
jgi:hypothetical protein